MQTAGTVDYYGRRALHPNYRNEFVVMSREHFLLFDVQAVADWLDVPVAMAHSKRALSPHWARAFAARLGDRAEVTWVESRGQTDFYDDPGLVATTADRLAMHFAAPLVPAAPASARPG